MKKFIENYLLHKWIRLLFWRKWNPDFALEFLTRMTCHLQKLLTIIQWCFIKIHLIIFSSFIEIFFLNVIHVILQFSYQTFILGSYKLISYKVGVSMLIIKCSQIQSHPLFKKIVYSQLKNPCKLNRRKVSIIIMELIIIIMMEYIELDPKLPQVCIWYNNYLLEALKIYYIIKYYIYYNNLIII